MCKFFSCVSDGYGKVMYFDATIRKQIIAGKLNYETTDSHTSIADYYGYKGAAEDKLNKYEYNPLTRGFIADQINTTDDSKLVEKFCRKLDFKTVVPELIIKPIVNPLLVKRKATSVTKREIMLLKEWAEVRAAVRATVAAAVRATVAAAVRAAVWAAVRATVADAVWAEVADAVWAEVWAYTSSFFNIKYKYNFSCCTKLWEAGLVPSYCGKVWRLHAGPKANIVYVMKRG